MQNEFRQLAYIAKDTKTYMNIEEARFRYSQKDDKHILFIIIPRNLQNNLSERMQQTVKPDLWDEIVWYYSLSNSISSDQGKKRQNSVLYKYSWDVREFFYNYLDRLKLDKIAARFKPCDLVFSAHKNTQEHLAAMLEPKELIMVDSGHRIFKRINKDGYIDYSKWFIAHSRFTRYMYWFTGLKVFDREKTTLFTVYADEIKTNHNVVKNDFDYQSHLLKSKDTGDEVVWISTPIYTMAHGVRIEDYASYIQSYLDYLEVDPQKLIYVPHPGKQSEEEIAYIKKALNCRIDDRDIPVEFKIANYNQLPGLVISPFSSALVNVNLASQGRIRIISAWHPEFSYFRMWSNWKKDVQNNPELEVDFVEFKKCPPLFNLDLEKPSDPAPYETFSDWEKKTVNV